MLHALNFIVVLVLLLPVLTSSLPQSNRWKEMYERLQAAGNSEQQNPVGEPDYVCCNQPGTRPPVPPIRLPPYGRPGKVPTGRGFLTRDVAAPVGSLIDSNQPAMARDFLYGRHLSPLQAAALSLDNTESRSSLLRRALEQLTRLQHQQKASASSQDAQLLAPAHSAAFLPPSGGLEDRYSLRKQGDFLARLLGAQAAVPSESEPLPIQLSGARKRDGGFVGAPGSAGGPNMFGR